MAYLNRVVNFALRNKLNLKTIEKMAEEFRIKKNLALKEEESVIVPTELAKASKESETMLRRIDDAGNINVSNLTPSEIDKYKRLSSSLQVKDINSISSYGSELQTSMTKYSNDFLKSVRSSRCGEIGGLIDNLLTELGYIDIEDFEEPNAFKKFLRKMPVLNKLVKSAEKILKKYDSIASNIETISDKIKAMRMLALRDNNALQEMFNNNIEYGTQIEELIIAGKIKLNEVDSIYEEMINNPDKYQSYEIQDVQMFKNNLERRINDMLVLRYVIKQSLPQIRTVQHNNVSIADKAQSLIAMTIPVWRNQLSIAVALNNQKNSIEAQRKISDTTNQILKKNADLLRENSIFVAKENERSVVDIQTLRESTQNLIDTIQEVKKIQEEASANRRMTEKELKELESQLESVMTSSVKR